MKKLIACILLCVASAFSQTNLGPLKIGGGSTISNSSNVAQLPNANVWTAANVFLGDLQSTYPNADIRAFGAKCDGTDAAPAIRSAIASGAPNILIPACIGTVNPYVISSFDPRPAYHGQNFMFYLNKGQAVFGVGGTLKVGNGALSGAAQRSIFMDLDADYVTVQNVNIDMNGAFNFAGSGGLYFDYFFSGIGSNHGTIRWNTITNSPGRNAIVVGGFSTEGTSGDDWNISFNVIQNGGTTLPGNVNQTDWSALYSEASNTTFEGNRILQPFSTIIQGSGGIEIHAAHSKAFNNYVEHAFPCMHVSGFDPSTITADVQIYHNECHEVPIAFNFFAYGNDFVQVNFDANTVTLKQNPAFLARVSTGLNMGFQSDGTWPTNARYVWRDSSFTDNNISATGETSAQIAQLHSMSKIHISGNHFTDMPGITGMEFFANPDNVDSVTVEGNYFTNIGAGGYGLYVTANAIDVHLDTWTPTTAYAGNKFVIPTVPNGFTYEVTTAGTTSGVEPTWPVILGNTVTDGTVTYTARSTWKVTNFVASGNSFTQVGTANLGSVRFRSTLNAGTVSAFCANNSGTGQTQYCYPFLDTGTTLLSAAQNSISLLKSVGTSLIAALEVLNPTASTAGVPVQLSPATHLSGRVWNTTSVADNYADWITFVSPTSGATPSHSYVWRAYVGTNVNGIFGVGTNAMALSNLGALSTQAGITSGSTLTATTTVTGTQLISNVATGTAPLAVTSTTPVANLSLSGGTGTTVKSEAYSTGTVCTNAGGTCAGAAGGRVTIAAAATTVTVATTRVTANSQIFVQEDSSLGTALSVTCNTTTGRTYTVTARTAATSFVITTSAAPVTNPACLSYFVIN